MDKSLTGWPWTKVKVNAGKTKNTHAWEKHTHERKHTGETCAYKEKEVYMFPRINLAYGMD